MLGLAPSAELIIEIADAETRKKVEVKNDKNQKVKKNDANAHGVTAQRLLLLRCPSAVSASLRTRAHAAGVVSAGLVRKSSAVFSALCALRSRA